MPSSGPKDASPLVATALALDAELRAYDQLAQEARRLRIDGEKALRRAIGLVRDSAGRNERIEERLRALVAEIESARVRHAESLEAVLEAARTLEERAQEHDALVQRLSAMADSARQVNEMAAQLSERRSAGAPDDELLGRLTEIETHMTGVVAEAEDLSTRARELEWPELARQADSVRQQVLSAKNRLALAHKAVAARVAT